MRIQHKYVPNGAKITGITMDNVSKVIDFTNAIGMDYVLLIGATETLGATRNLGNNMGGAALCAGA
jgi:hypothetical protein